MEDFHQNGKQICRLCLMKCDKYEVIERNIRSNMDVLVPNINILLSEGPTMCKNCAEIVKKCFYFKTMCLDTYKCIVLCNGGKSNIKIDLKNIYLRKKECVTGIPEDCNICGFCMGLVKSCFAIYFGNEEDNMLQKMFDTCFPELDFSIVKKPVICGPCHGHLQEYFSFMTNCLFVEEEIRKYCETLDIKSNKTLMDLTDVLQFTLRNKVIEGADVNTIDKNKKEKYRRSPELFIEVGEYKNDSVTEVKDQKNNNLLQFPLQNISLDVISKEGTKIELKEEFCDNSENIVEERKEIKCELETFVTIEDYKFDNTLFPSRSMSEEVGVIKREETFFEEQTLQKNENYVGVEDQKYLLNDEIEIKSDPHDFGRFQSDSSKLKMSDDFLKLQNYSELGYHLSPSEALFHETSREYRNDVGKHEPITEESLRNPLIRGYVTPPKHHSDISIYQCESCSIQTKHERSLTTHLLRDKNSPGVTRYQYKSCTCQTNYEGNRANQSFNVDTSRVKMYRCILCPFQTNYANSLKNHSLLHKDPTKLTINQCESCPYQTHRKDRFKRHLLVHSDPSKITMYQCEFCPFQAKRKDGLKNHLLVHKDTSEVTMYQCESCSYQTKRKDKLKIHLLIHMDPSKVTVHQCESCPFQTKRKGTLKIHSLAHNDPSNATIYQCESCSYQTQLKDRLKRHLLIHSDPSKITMYQCESCPFQAKRKDGLKNHLLVHKDSSEVTMHQCESCSYQTKRKDKLKIHLLIHVDPSKVTGYQCESCPFQTKRKSSLKIHSLVHKDPAKVVMYQCESCPYQTQHKDRLRRHSLVHSDPSKITMYQCESCPFQTKRKDGLKNHLLVHKDSSEVTMYQCESCSYQTKRKDKLKIHLLIHVDPSKVTGYQCDSCPFQTKRQCDLNKHLRWCLSA